MTTTIRHMYRYSPLPIEKYTLAGLPVDEVSVIRRGAYPDAVWNFFWLSTPQIDLVPDAGVNWWRHYKPIIGALSSITVDVHTDEVLFRKLLMHPMTFHEWFQREDHSIYDTYEVLGGQPWVDTVLARAMVASDRLTQEEPPVTVSGNVIRVNFRRVA